MSEMTRSEFKIHFKGVNSSIVKLESLVKEMDERQRSPYKKITLMSEKLKTNTRDLVNHTAASEEDGKLRKVFFSHTATALVVLVVNIAFKYFNP